MKTTAKNVNVSNLKKTQQLCPKLFPSDLRWILNANKITLVFDISKHVGSRNSNLPLQRSTLLNWLNVNCTQVFVCSFVTIKMFFFSFFLSYFFFLTMKYTMLNLLALQVNIHVLIFDLIYNVLIHQLMLNEIKMWYNVS